MKRQKKWALIFSVLALLLVLVYCIFLLPQGEETPSVDPNTPSAGEGEGLLHNVLLLYPSLDRKDIVSVSVQNGKNTYAFERYAGTDADGTPKEVTPNTEFVIRQGDIYYGHIDYDLELFAELIVAVGTPYARQRLLDTEVTEEVYREYGLSEADDPAVLEVTTFAGETYRLYVGDPTITGGGYYLRLEGRDAVYVSQTADIGSCAYADVTYYVKPVLTAIFANYGFYYTKDFTLWHREEAQGTEIEADDVVYMRYRTTLDGVTADAEIGSFELKRQKLAMQEALIGRAVGDEDFVFSLTYSAYDNNTELRGKTVQYYVEEILAVEKKDIALDFLNHSQREDFHAGGVYTITAPQDKVGYTPDSGTYMTILEQMEALTGEETVHVGLSEAVLDAYGLRAFRLYYESPYGVSSSKTDPEDIVVSSYIPNVLYISEETADGYRYVGSALYDIVAKVPAAQLDFLEQPFSYWVDKSLFSVNILHTAELGFDFLYADAKESYTFRLSNNGEKTTGVRLAETEKSLSLDNWKNLYMNLLTIYYRGDYAGDVSAETLTASEENAVLALTLKLTNGEEHRYMFYPYTPRKVLVSLDGGAYFYISSAEVEKLYADIQKILQGETPDPHKNY